VARLWDVEAGNGLVTQHACWTTACSPENCANIMWSEEGGRLLPKFLVWLLLADMSNIGRGIVFALREHTWAGCSLVQVFFGELPLADDGPRLGHGGSEANKGGDDCDNLHLEKSSGMVDRYLGGSNECDVTVNMCKGARGKGAALLQRRVAEPAHARAARCPLSYCQCKHSSAVPQR
jgi:hypothetical protein